MKSNYKIIVEHHPEALALNAARIFTDTALSAINDRGKFTVALSGGSTPRLFHNQISKSPFVFEIPWEKAHVFWSDERCVPYYHPYSNFGAAKNDLIDHIPIPMSNVHPMPVDCFPEKGAIGYEEELLRYFNLKRGDVPRFDIIFLGIGTDGHIASLFPGGPALEEKKRLVVPVNGGEPDVDRLTLTFPVINCAGNIVMLVSGRHKAEILKVILEDEYAELPAQKVCPADGSITWLVDEAAALLLTCLNKL